MAKKIAGKKNAVGKVPDSISEDGSRGQAAAANKKPSQKAGGRAASSVSVHEKVALLAYSYWEERGRLGGSPEEDWYRAEREVLDQATRGNS